MDWTPKNCGYFFFCETGQKRLLLQFELTPADNIRRRTHLHEVFQVFAQYWAWRYKVECEVFVG